MSARLSPLRVDEQTDELISHAAHFLGRSKKSLVDDAVREYVENHRAEINKGVIDALGRLDGTAASGVSMATGLSRARLDELGGITE